MVRSGREVMAQLTATAQAARRDADAAESAARRVREQADALGRERLQTLRDLAATQMPQLDAATADQAMPAVVAELQQFERDRQDRQAQLQAQIAAAVREQAEGAARLASETRELDAVVARRDALLAEVGKRLAADAKYQALEAEATQGEVRLARDVARADELRAEAKEKLPPYQHSRLFQYLWRREFGTPQYRSRGFVARFDRRLAEFIGYTTAVASYRFLEATPKLVALEVQRRTEDVKDLQHQIELMEDAIEAAVGVPPVQEEVDRRAIARDALVSATEQVAQRLASLHASVREETGNRGVFYERALARLTSFLAKAEQGAMESHACATPDRRDDQLVQALRACTDQLARVQREATPIEASAHRLDAIADGLDELVTRFRRADYDAGRSEFHLDHLEALLPEARSGALPAEDLWGVLRGSQRFAPPPIRHHQQRSTDVMQGIGVALQIVGAVAQIAGGVSRSRGGGFGASIGRSIGGGGGGGFGIGRSIGGGGGGGFGIGRSI